MYDNILGVFNRSIDNKYRIVVPKFAGVEKDEELVIIIKKDYFEIKELKTIIAKIKNIESKLETASNKETLSFYQDMKNEITACIGHTLKKDSNDRIILGRSIIERYNLNNEVVIEGIMDGLRLWNPTKFNEYQESIMNKKTRK